MEQWTYVIAAYSITVVTLLAYTLVLNSRLRAERQRLTSEQSARPPTPESIDPDAAARSS